jgi:hypothetical protein
MKSMKYLIKSITWFETLLLPASACRSISRTGTRRNLLSVRLFSTCDAQEAL